MPILHVGKLLVAALGLLAPIALTVAPSPATAQGKVHAILLGDTQDPGIGSGARENVAGVNKLVTAIATALGTTANVSLLTEANFSCVNLANAVRAITTAADDLVVFYYSGHGFREDGQRSKFPRLWCRGMPTDNPLLEEIALGFRSTATPPRMVWAVADACNVTAEDTSALTASVGATQLALRKLFGQTSGTLIMAGADMHQFSWYYPSGGQFSKNLLDVMNLEVQRGNSASWASILPRSMRPFETRYNNRTFIQQPIHQSTLIEP